MRYSPSSAFASHKRWPSPNQLDQNYCFVWKWSSPKSTEIHWLIPDPCSQLKSRSSSPWGAWLFFFCLSKNDDRSLDFISTLARFFLDPMCEINSKGPDPPRSPPGYSLPKRTQGGVQPLDFISLQFLNFIFVLLEAWYLSYFQMSAPFNLGPTYTFDWIGRNNNLDWWNWWNPLQNWRQTVRCMKFILLSIAAMFIKLTVAHFLTLKPYCFWTFRSRYVKILNLTQTKRLPNPVLLLFPDSCFDQAGRSLEEKPRRNKIYVPNLDRWTPLQNWHQPQVHIFSWETCDMFIHVYQLSHHGKGNHVNIISSWNPFFVELSHQGNIEIDPKNTQPNPGYQRLIRSTSSRIAAWT